MSTKLAVLGLVDEKPGHPYEIASRFRHRVGPPWRLNTAQVYQAVNQMESEGLVAVSPGSGRRQHVEATDQGREELRRWRESPTAQVPPVRDPLLLKLLAARLPEDGLRLLGDIEERERVTTRLIEKYSATRREYARRSGEGSWEQEVPDLALEAAVQRLEADLVWLASARERIVGHDGASENGKGLAGTGL